MNDVQELLDEMFKYVGNRVLYSLLSHAHSQRTDISDLKGGIFSEEKFIEVLEECYENTEIFNDCGLTGMMIINANTKHLIKIILEELPHFSIYNTTQSQFFQEKLMRITNNVIESLKKLG